MTKRNEVRILLTAQDETGAAFRSMQQNMQASVLKANLMSTGIIRAIDSIVNVVSGAARGAFRSLSDALGSAGAELVTFDDIAKVTGWSLKDATAYTRQMQIEMGRLAAALPGTTDDYIRLATGITDNLVPAFRDLYGNIDQDALLDATKALSAFGAMRASVSDGAFDVKDAALGISKALSGTRSLRQLATLQFFERNVAILDAMQKAEDETGVAWKEMDARQRVQILRAAMSLSDETIKNAQESALGLIEGLKSQLFDPRTGALGMLRTFKLDGIDTTIVQEVNTVVKALFALLGSVAALLPGQDTFILQALGRGLQRLTVTIQSISAWVDANATSLMDALNVGDVGSVLANALNAIDFRSVGEVFGTYAGRITTVLLENTLSFLAGLDYGNILGGVVASIGAFLSQLDLGTVLKAAGVALGAIAAQVTFTAVLGALGTLAASLGAAILSTVGLPALLIGAGVASIVILITTQWNNISNAIRENLGNILRTALGVLVPATQLILPLVELVRNVFQTLTRAFRAIANAVTIPTLPRPATTSAQPASIGTMMTRAGGQIPDAIRRELRMAPTGALPVIANTSELILNQAQQRNMVTSLNNRGGGLALTIAPGAITINGATDPQTTAQMVISEIERRLERRWALGVG